MMKIASALVLLACLAPLGCVVTSGPPASNAPSPVLYYYGGAHYYPVSLGGDWCGVSDPHAHDFPPDHPECYSRDLDYYYYTGCNNETPVIGRVPAGATVHTARPHAPHEPVAVPAGAPRAPHLATGRIPTRVTHPAPAQPIPPAPIAASPTNPASPRPMPMRPAARPAAPPPATPAPATPPTPAPSAVTPPATTPTPPRPVPLRPPRGELPRSEPNPPTSPPTPPTPPADPKRPSDPRDPKDDNATKPKRSPDPRDPKDDNAKSPPTPPLRYTPPANRKDATRLAPVAPKP
jgi:hypothetical protein